MDYFDDFGWHTTDPAFRHRVASAPCPTTPPAEGSGWNWTGFVWVELRIPAPPSAAEPVTPVRHISVGSFFDRFGANKWPILADMNPLVQALIKDCSVRKFINLDDPQLPDGLGLLVEAGHTIDPAAVLGAEVQPGERP